MCRNGAGRERDPRKLWRQTWEAKKYRRGTRIQTELERAGRQECKTWRNENHGRLFIKWERWWELFFKGMNLPAACSTDFMGVDWRQETRGRLRKSNKLEWTHDLAGEVPRWCPSLYEQLCPVFVLKAQIDNCLFAWILNAHLTSSRSTWKTWFCPPNKFFPWLSIFQQNNLLTTHSC